MNTELALQRRVSKLKDLDHAVVSTTFLIAYQHDRFVVVNSLKSSEPIYTRVGYFQ